jgi:hypothetical protein
LHTCTAGLIDPEKQSHFQGKEIFNLHAKIIQQGAREVVGS